MTNTLRPVLVYPFDLQAGSIGGGGYGQLPLWMTRTRESLRRRGIDSVCLIQPDESARRLDCIMDQLHALTQDEANRRLVCVSFDGGSELVLADVVDACRTILEARVVLGGRLPALYPDDYTWAVGADAVCLGDGPACIAELAALMNAGVEFEEACSRAGFFTPRGGRPRVVPAHTLRDAVTAQYGVMPWESTRSLLVETSVMNCPARCSFCVESKWADAVGVQRRADVLSADDVFDLLRRLWTDYATRQVTLLDLDFFADWPRARRVLELVERHAPESFSLVAWASVMSLSRLSDDEIVWCGRKGRLALLHVGFESFSDAQLRRYRKPSSAARNEEQYRRLVRLRLRGAPAIDALFVPWDPDATPLDVAENFSVLAQVAACPYSWTMQQLLNRLFWTGSGRAKFSTPARDRLTQHGIWRDDWEFVDPRTAVLFEATRVCVDASKSAHPCVVCDRAGARGRLLDGISSIARDLDLRPRGSWKKQRGALAEFVAAWCASIVDEAPDDGGVYKRMAEFIRAGDVDGVRAAWLEQDARDEDAERAACAEVTSPTWS